MHWTRRRFMTGYTATTWCSKTVYPLKRRLTGRRPIRRCCHPHGAPIFCERLFTLLKMLSMYGSVQGNMRLLINLVSVEPSMIARGTQSSATRTAAAELVKKLNPALRHSSTSDNNITVRSEHSRQITRLCYLIRSNRCHVSISNLIIFCDRLLDRTADPLSHLLGARTARTPASSGVKRIQGGLPKAYITACALTP
jgi:hypothetical protein